MEGRRWSDAEKLMSRFRLFFFFLSRGELSPVVFPFGRSFLLFATAHRPPGPPHMKRHLTSKKLRRTNQRERERETRCPQCVAFHTETHPHTTILRYTHLPPVLGTTLNYPSVRTYLVFFI